MPNSASRIHSILYKFKHGVSGGNTLERWALALNCPNNLESVAPLLVDLAQQLDQVVLEIRNKFNKGKADTMLELFPRLRQAICFKAIESNWGPVNESLSDAALQSLKIVVHDIDDEPDIKADDLANIKKQVNDLFDEVHQSDLKKSLKTWILNCLSAIRTAIDRFQISGIKGLQDALIKVKGEIEFFLPAVEEVAKANPTLCQKLFSLLDVTYKATEIPDRCRKICESPITANLMAFGVSNFEHIQKLLTGG